MVFPTEGERKIVSKATEGLLETYNSLAYRVAELERHIHNRERWFGRAVTPNAELHVADRAHDSAGPFVLTSGVQDFGAWVQVLGSTDTPITPGSVYFDPHRFLITNTDDVNPYVIQLISGEQSEFATKLATGQFTEIMWISATNSIDAGIEALMAPRILCGQKCWARACCCLASNKTISFFFGLHEYEG